MRPQEEENRTRSNLATTIAYF